MNLSLENCLDFFRFLQDQMKIPLRQLQHVRSFVTISRRLTSRPFTESELEIIKKFLGGILNQNPQKVVTAPVSWDIETMFKYLSKLPNNKNLILQQLGGKVALLILLSTMCRSREVVQL